MMWQVQRWRDGQWRYAIGTSGDYYTAVGWLDQWRKAYPEERFRLYCLTCGNAPLA